MREAASASSVFGAINQGIGFFNLFEQILDSFQLNFELLINASQLLTMSNFDSELLEKRWLWSFLKNLFTKGFKTI